MLASISTGKSRRSANRLMALETMMMSKIMKTCRSPDSDNYSNHHHAL